jgi:hypothetical protein
MTEATHSSETWVFTKETRCHIPEDDIHHSQILQGSNWQNYFKNLNSTRDGCETHYTPDGTKTCSSELT